MEILVKEIRHKIGKYKFLIKIKCSRGLKKTITAPIFRCCQLRQGIHKYRNKKIQNQITKVYQAALEFLLYIFEQNLVT